MNIEPKRLEAMLKHVDEAMPKQLVEAMQKLLFEIPSEEDYAAVVDEWEKASKSEREVIQRKLSNMRRVIAIDQLVRKILSEIDHSEDGYPNFATLERFKRQWIKFYAGVNESIQNTLNSSEPRKTVTKDGIPITKEEILKYMNEWMSKNNRKQGVKEAARIQFDITLKTLNKRIK